MPDAVLEMRSAHLITHWPRRLRALAAHTDGKGETLRYLDAILELDPNNGAAL